jgi:hypothetical protein
MIGVDAYLGSERFDRHQDEKLAWFFRDSP